MSTGVDSQQPSDIQILNSGTRQRSVSQSHGSLLPQSVESPQFTDKESVKMVSQSQKSRWLKTGAIIGFIFMLLLWLSPSKSTGYSGYSAGKSSGSSVETKCTKPYDSSKPLIQYALMIDAGSTGSRIHVYRFNNCGPTPELENEVFEQTAKKEGGSSGLSSYKEDAEGAAKSLDPLMEVAMSSVPAEYKSCTPIAVKATAGLRFLGAEMSKNILEAVRTRLETVYPFPVVSREKGGVEIMDGSDEGVYAWITTNYLLGKIGGPDENPTAAVFDLGGGSTQIVFQPTFEKSKTGGMPEHLAEGDHKYELKFGGHEFDLYQHSHLGYGLMSARNSMNLVVLDAMLAKNPKDLSWKNSPIANPCIQPNMQKEVKIELPAGHVLGEKEVTVIMAGPQSGGSAAQCRAIAEKILKKDADCTLAPCSFNGVHQPSLEKTFSREDVYIFSYFYDRTNPLGMPSSFTLDELHQLTASVCGGEGSWSVFSGVENALTELRGRPDTCMDLNFMFSLLHTGYEMPLSREVKTAKKIKGNELGWCLGASLPLLSQESGWTCRIKEVS